MDSHAKAVQASYVYSKQSAEKSKQYVATNLPGFHLHEGLSDNHSVVLHNHKTNEVIIGYRGTLNDIHHPIQSLQDLGADAEIALGLHHIKPIQREQEADAKYHRVASVFPKADISTSGHSLGGVESYYVATKNNLDGHHFNIGESPIGGIETLNNVTAHFHEGQERFDRQHIYHAENYKGLGNVYKGSDPLSVGTKYLAGQHHSIKVNRKTDIGAHELGNFIKSPHKTQSVATIHVLKSEQKNVDEFDVQLKKKKKKHYLSR